MHPRITLISDEIFEPAVWRLTLLGPVSSCESLSSLSGVVSHCCTHALCLLIRITPLW